MRARNYPEVRFWIDLFRWLDRKIDGWVYRLELASARYQLRKAEERLAAITEEGPERDAARNLRDARLEDFDDLDLQPIRQPHRRLPL